MLELQDKLPGYIINNYKSRESFLKALPETQIAITWYFRQEWLERAIKLECLATPAAGRDFFHIQLPPQIKSYYGSFHGQIMAETVVGMILCSARGLIHSFSSQKKLTWNRSLLEPNLTTIRNSHVLLLGFGNIGKKIAELLKPFGVRITGIRLHKTKKSDYPSFFQKQDRILTINELDKELPFIDHLILSLPRLKSTDLILNSIRLRMLPTNATIYNVGRGNAIDEKALIKLLRNKKLKGAYMDVFKNEPLSFFSPLRRCPNSYLLPHASAMAPEYMNLFIREFTSYLKEI